MRRFSGKIVGLVLGFIFGGPMGALVGLVIGFLHDAAPPAPFLARDVPHPRGFKTKTSGDPSMFPPTLTDGLQRSTYLIGIIVLSAKMAKSDGRVSRQEIDAFRQVFRIPDSEVAQVGTLFDQARENPAGYEPYAARLAQVFRYNPLILEEILSGLFRIALADSPVLSRQEDSFLRRVGLVFGFAQDDFLRIAARSGVHNTQNADRAQDKSPLAESYAVLGLPATTSAADIKKTYRVLIRKHHPDKLAAQGLPAELIAQATEKMKRINAAYAAISKDRGIK